MTIHARGYAARTAGSPLAPWNFERRQPGPRDVRFDILYCGVCHSDLHQIRNEWYPGIFPMIPGHEIVGRVTAVGRSVKKFSAGDTVAVGCLVDSCRVCDNCKEGLEQYCTGGPVGTYNSRGKDGALTYGGYSDTMVVDEDFALRVSARLPLPAVAPLLCAGITTWSPLRHWNVGHGHKLAVLGLGGLGHMAVRFGAAFGAEVTVLSTSPDKEEDARRLGAHHFIVTTDKSQMKIARGSFHYILDTVSSPHDFKSCLSLLRTNGTQILVGLPAAPIELPPFSLVNGRRSIAGSSIGGIAETQEMLDYCATHGIVCDIELIDIKDINQAFGRMLRGDVRYRFVIDMGTL